MSHPSSRLAAVYGWWLAVAVIYWPSSAALSAIWGGSRELGHGYLVLVVSLWLVARNRQRLAAAPIRPATGALPLAIALSLAWLVCWRAAAQDLHLLLLPLLMLIALAAGLGWSIAGVLLFPVGYLYLAVPAWDQLTGSLQTLSARVNGVLIWLAGVPAMMDGNLIRLPMGTIRIAGGCSGLHTLLVGLAVAALYGEILRDSVRRRLAWLALMAVISLLTNWIRIFVVTAVAYQTDMRSPLVRHHEWLGWWLFVFAVAGFLWLAGRLGTSWNRRRSREVQTPEALRLPLNRVRLGRVAATLTCLGILPALAYGTDVALARSQRTVIIEWAAAPQGWSGPQPVRAGEWAPRFLDPSVEDLRRYVDAQGRSIEVFAVAYRTQTQRGKLLGYRNTLLGADHLYAQSERMVNASTGHWQETLAVDSLGVGSLIWSRYRIGERRFIRGRLAQLWYGMAALANPPVSSLTALRAVCRPDCAAARARLAGAATELEPAVRLATQPRDR